MSLRRRCLPIVPLVGILSRVLRTMAFPCGEDEVRIASGEEL